MEAVYGVFVRAELRLCDGTRVESLPLPFDEFEVLLLELSARADELPFLRREVRVLEVVVRDQLEPVDVDRVDDVRVRTRPRFRTC